MYSTYMERHDRICTYMDRQQTEVEVGEEILAVEGDTTVESNLVGRGDKTRRGNGRPRGTGRPRIDGRESSGRYRDRDIETACEEPVYLLH